jgi:hypothetical protein
MTNEIKVDGACYCGKVTINGSVSADKVMACHCTDCQKFSGAPFRAAAVLLCDRPPDDAVMPGDAVMPSDDAVNAACHLTG